METVVVSSATSLYNVQGSSESLNSLGIHDNDILQKMISDSDRRWLEIVFYGILTGTISFFGIIANIINIVIFLKQGLNDTVNISLLGLAVSDLGGVLTWMAISLQPLLWYCDIPPESVDILHITAGWPNDCFSRTTCWITVYVTFERCLCIALPLKVKTIITVKRTTLIILGIFLTVFLTTSPVFYAIRISPMFVAERNKTLPGIVYVDRGVFLENIVLSISAFTQLSSFPCVIICTVVIVRNLISKSQWRKAASGLATSSEAETSATLRDKRVVKMVSSIACIFITCFSPICINIILTILLSPDYNVGGRHENAFAISWAIISCFTATNSTVNIFVYYKMSSKFRTEFNKLFGINRSEKENIK